MTVKKIIRSYISYGVLFLFALLISSCASRNNNLPKLNELFVPKESQNETPQYPSVKKDITPPILQNKLYKIALFLPLSSESFEIKKAATSLLNAARLAHKEINNKNMDLVVYPIGDSEETIIPVVQRAINDKVDIVLGPLLAPSVVTVKKLTEPSKIPMIAFSNDQTTVQGNYSYLLSYLPEQNIANIVNYAFSQGHKNFGLFASDTPYGKRVGSTFLQEVSSRQGSVTNTVYFTENAPDFYEKTNQIAEVEMRHLETTPTSWTSIMFPDRASLMMQTMPLLSRHNINLSKVLILGTSLWEDPRILEIEELNNAVFAAPNQNTLKIFETRYMTAYKEKPTTLASLAYDAVALASGLIRQYPNNPFAQENITNPDGFTGVGGIFRFRPDGLSERGLSILRIQNKKFNVVIPAPETFAGS